jgi:hypothetical protein
MKQCGQSFSASGGQCATRPPSSPQAKALRGQERREAASWKKVYAAAAKRKAKRAAAKPAAPAKKRA